MLSHTAQGYSAHIYAKLGKGREHARLLYQEVFRTGQAKGNHPAFANAPLLREEILACTDLSLPQLLERGDEAETKKYLLQTEEGLEYEMVLLPMSAGNTLCISSQVGCAMGCAFCETGKMGLLRNLSTREITAQLFHARHTLGQEVRNLVFMGMGEPLDNFEAVKEAIAVFTDMNGFGLGPSRLTVSTSGCVPQIYRMIEEIDPAVNLAVSVNASTDESRSRLMPINRCHDMAELKEAMLAYCAHPRRRIFAEYVVIAGRNDTPDDARRLAAYLQGLRVTVNLIPYNPGTVGTFQPGDPESLRKMLTEAGFRVFVRETKGQKIMAACGQLGNRRLRNKLTRPIFTS